MTRADARADEIYDELRAEFGEDSPKASGYLSEYSFRREREMVLEAVGAEPGTVVDLACGAGLVALPLARAGRRVIGVDFNAAACRQAGRNGLGAIRGNAFRLPLADGLADTVLNVEFAQSYDPEAVEQMLHEVVRVLRPAGRLVIVWGHRAALIHRIVHPIASIPDRRQGWGPSFNHTPLRIRAAGKRAGLRLDEVWAIFPPLRLRLRRADGPLAGLIGSSFVAVFRKQAGP